MSRSKIVLSTQSTSKKAMPSLPTSSPQSSISFPIPNSEAEEDESLVLMVNGDNDGAEGPIMNEKSLRSMVWKYATKITAHVAQCNICLKKIKTNSGGTTSLRKHLLRQHKISDVPSHRPSYKTINNPISKQQKDRLDHLVKIATFEDGRTFGDFRKNGMMKFLSEAVPGKTFPES